MDPYFLHLIDSFQGSRTLVIGEAMLDSYLAGSSERLCREAPVPVVSVTDREHVPGGAANTAVNLHSLGSDVYFISVIGSDPEASLLRRSLTSNGVGVGNLIVDPKRSTLAKQRVIAEAQLVVRFDQGSTEAIAPEVENQIIERIQELYPLCDLVVLSDYDYGIFTPRVIQALARLQNDSPRIIVADSKRLDIFRELQISAVKPNYTEALMMLNLERNDKLESESGGNRIAQILDQGHKLLEISGAQIVAITLDQDGALVFEAGNTPYRTYAYPESNSRAAGAGDTYVSAMALALAAGANKESAAEIASAAASIVVNKKGTAACYADELKAFFSADDKYLTDAFQLAARMAAYRREGRRIVFTNGCFDILHRGHINYLNQAKSFGDILIVGLNSDDSVRRLKGPARPINTLDDRAQVLAALSCIDHIVPFDGDTPHDLIRSIQPDIFVKGGDYTRETLPEAGLVERLGGEVKILPYLQDRSTTGIIDRIRKLDMGTPAKS